jgi:hypothetical protein
MNKGGGGVGPTSDGRRKPDLFAPGTSIVSASTAACGTTSLTGTSMACPAATAAGALIRQYFVDGFYPTGAATPANAFVPTGALVKAVMVNTCQDMTGVAATVPNNTEGWGRLVLDETLHFSGDLGRMWVADVRRANGLVTGGQRTFTVDVASAVRPLEITMAFTDFAGAVNAAAAAVNNLNLEVTAPNGAVFLGNAFSGGFSLAGGAADAINNVERVAVAAPAVGTWTIRVVGAAVPQGPCGYALCASGDLGGGFGLASVATYGAGKPGTLGVPSITASSSKATRRRRCRSTAARCSPTRCCSTSCSPGRCPATGRTPSPSPTLRRSTASARTGSSGCRTIRSPPAAIGRPRRACG